MAFMLVTDDRCLEFDWFTNSLKRSILDFESLLLFFFSSIEESTHTISDSLHLLILTLLSSLRIKFDALFSSVGFLFEESEVALSLCISPRFIKHQIYLNQFHLH